MATFTDKQMQARPTQSDIWLVDSGARGSGRLVGRITPSGKRLLYYRYTGGTGVQVRLPIGPYDARGDGRATFTVQQARDRAREWSALYRSGVKDLREHIEEEARARQAQAEQDQRERDEAAQAAARRLTLRQLAEQWARVELTPKTQADGTRTGRKDAGASVLKTFARRVFPQLGELPADTVTKGDLMGVLDAVVAEGAHRAANMLLTDLRQMFRFGLDREIVRINPLGGILKKHVGGKETERSRVLSEDEIRTLAVAVLSALPPRSTCTVWLILATACRIGEATGARWEHIDLARRTWHLPQTKNQRDHTIHLSDFAMAQLKALADLRDAEHRARGEPSEPSPWVIPGRDWSRAGSPKALAKQLGDRQRAAERRLSGRAKTTSALMLPGGQWTPHDLRRTAATLLAGLGFGQDVIDECLNHKIQSKSARTYIRDRRRAEQARAFEALGAKLLELTTGTGGATNVTPMRTRKRV
jgi:integrase